MVGLAIASAPSLALAGGVGRSFGSMAVLAVVMAAGNAMANPARQALVADVASRQGFTMGVYGAAEDIGILIGPLVGGVVWDRGGRSWAFASFSIAYVVTCVLVGLLLNEERAASLDRHYVNLIDRRSAGVPAAPEPG
jgi:MFS family permease